MIKLDPILPTYPSDHTSQHTWARLAELLKDDGHGFYRHPNLSLYGASQFPDFVILTRSHFPLVVKCLDLTLDQLNTVSANGWTKVD